MEIPLSSDSEEKNQRKFFSREKFPDLTQAFAGYSV
jgi:hypothetical protein